MVQFAVAIGVLMTLYKLQPHLNILLSVTALHFAIDAFLGI